MKKISLLVILTAMFWASCAYAAQTIGTSPEAVAQKLNAQSIKNGWTYSDGKKVLFPRPEYNKNVEGNTEYSMEINRHVELFGEYNPKNKQASNMILALHIPFSEVDDQLAKENATVHMKIAYGIIDLFAPSSPENASAKSMYLEVFSTLGDAEGTGSSMKLNKNTNFNCSTGFGDDIVLYLVEISPVVSQSAASANTNIKPGEYELVNDSQEGGFSLTKVGGKYEASIGFFNKNSQNVAEFEGPATLSGNKIIIKDTDGEGVVITITVDKGIAKIEANDAAAAYAGAGAYFDGIYKCTPKKM
jgi:hypothetical protein